MNAQVDMHLRERCGDSYKAPDEDDMGNNLLNNVFVGDDAIRQLASSLAESSSTAKSEASAVPSQPKRSLIPDWLKTLGMILATALGTGAAMSYFGDDDTDTRNIYEIEAVPFNPDPEPINATDS